MADAALGAVDRLDEIPGIGPDAAQVIIAEIGLDMSRFPTAAHLVSWAKLCPRTIQSGPLTRGGKTGKGNPYLKGALGDAAAAAAKTNTFLGERYRRIVKRRGKLKALVAVARSILVIVWHLLDRPRRPLPRPRPRLPRPPHRHRTPDAQPHRPTHRAGLPGHPRTRRLTNNPRTRSRNMIRLRCAPPDAVACPLTRVIYRSGVVMPETRRKYDPEFKEGAVRIVRETGKPIAQIARDLGVHEGTLGNWVAKDRAEREGTEGLSMGDAAELKRLRAENAQLRMERDVLKRSVVLWVKEATK